MIKIYRFIFVLLFLFFLIFFGVFLNVKEGYEDKSQFENRLLFQVKDIKNTQDVEKYISDHIPFREELIRIYFSANLKAPQAIQTNIEGKDEWVFLGKNPTGTNLPVLAVFQNKILLSQKQLLKMVDNVKKVKQYCDENKIKFYLMFPPDKSRVYSFLMPSYIVRKNNLSVVEEFLRLLPKDINVISLEKELIDEAVKTYTQETDSLLYYKEDTHWTEEATFLAYQLLMSKIKIDFPEINVLSRDDFNIDLKIVYLPYYIGSGPIFGRGNIQLPKFEHKTNWYNYFTYKNIDDVQIIWDKNFKQSINSNINANPLNVYIVGDSFACYLHPFLSSTFHHVRAYRFNMPGEDESNWGIKFNERKKEFEKEKPDILIFSISDLKLRELLRVD